MYAMSTLKANLESGIANELKLEKLQYVALARAMNLAGLSSDISESAGSGSGLNDGQV